MENDVIAAQFVNAHLVAAKGSSGWYLAIEAEQVGHVSRIFAPINRNFETKDQAAAWGRALVRALASTYQHTPGESA